MLVPCEVAVRCALPAIRAMIAKELTTRHRLTQLDAANLLGMSQPAISLYARSHRGKAIDLENDHDVQKLVNDMAAKLAQKTLTHKGYIQAFCQICRLIRAKGLMCKLHEKLDSSITVEKCEICTEIAAISCP